MVRRNLEDRQFTSWLKEVDDRMQFQDALKRERGRRRDDRNGHKLTTKGLRERKCFRLEQDDIDADSINGEMDA